MRSSRSAWILVALAILGIALLGFGCERTIGDNDFIPIGSVSGGGSSGSTGGGSTNDDGTFTGEL